MKLVCKYKNANTSLPIIYRINTKHNKKKSSVTQCDDCFNVLYHSIVSNQACACPMKTLPTATIILWHFSSFVLSLSLCRMPAASASIHSFSRWLTMTLSGKCRQASIRASAWSRSLGCWPSPFFPGESKIYVCI